MLIREKNLKNFTNSKKKSSFLQDYVVSARKKVIFKSSWIFYHEEYSKVYQKIAHKVVTNPQYLTLIWL